MESLLPQLLEIWRSPECRRLTSIFVWLGAVNAGFWILARAAGALVDLFSEFFWEEVWEALATVYNLVLAVFFSAILFVSATRGADPGELWWREACGFVMLYIALGSAYFDPDTNELIDAAKPGYVCGLFVYIVFAAMPWLVRYPVLITTVELLKSLSDSWIGKGLTTFAALGVAWSLATKGLSRMFHVLAPFLYWAKIIKHPAIRVRRRG